MALYIHAKKITNNLVEVDLETLLVLNIFKLCNIGTINLHVTIKADISTPTFLTDFNHALDVDNNLDIVTYVKWPALIQGNKSVVAGICSVARQLLKCSMDENSQFLLGFRESCLAACSESSIWTKFCEVDMVSTVKSILGVGKAGLTATKVILPDDLIRFEYHMQQPVRMHNVYKVAREAQNDSSINSSVPISQLNIPHCYSEGPYMTLADAILLPSMEILLWKFSDNIFKEFLPLTYKWIEKMRLFERYHHLSDFLTHLEPNIFSWTTIPVEYDTEIKKLSLYSADPNRYKPANRIYTKQNDIENALNIIGTSEITLQTTPIQLDLAFNWKDIPMVLRPEGGALPKKRSKRKEEQLENLTIAVLKIVQQISNREKNSFKIVDFCSGSGHLGLLLAYLLPHCEIILVENKEKSLERALNRIETLHMRNVVVLQSNLDYFIGNFDIGVALHACGVATDLVMQTCIYNSAHFVCCPCCYGGIHDCSHLKFPRSEEFKQTVGVDDYLKIAHAADQTHDKKNLKTAQGYKCMNIIDTDRRLYAEAGGYAVQLGKLFPETCTPKNNLLVGILE